MAIPSSQVNHSDDLEGANPPVYYLEAARADEVSLMLQEIQARNWTIGSFFRDVLAAPMPRKKDCRSDCHIAMVSKFLRGWTREKPDLIAEMMYSHRYSYHTKPRASKNRTAAEALAAQRPRALMSQGMLEEWAIRKVEGVVSSDADMMSSKDGGFHLDDSSGTWERILNFSLTKVLAAAESKAPTLLRILLCAAFSTKNRPKPQPVSTLSGDAPDSHSQSVDDSLHGPSASQAMNSEAGAMQQGSGRNGAQEGCERNNTQEERERGDAQDGRERVSTQEGGEHEGTLEGREWDGALEGCEHHGALEGDKRAGALDEHGGTAEQEECGDTGTQEEGHENNGTQQGHERDGAQELEHECEDAQNATSDDTDSDPPRSYANYFSKPPPSGRGNNRRNPFTILLVALMLLMHARNLQFSAFRKMMGVWLFAHTAQNGVYTVLSRLGISSSYTSVLKFLRALSKSAQSKLRETAKLRAFLLIYDNINRMFRAWDPDLGQKDTIHNGTAATFVEVEDCDPEKAFDPEPLRRARQEQRRSQLTHDTLIERLDHQKLHSVLALHCLSFLVDEVPSLESHREFVRLRFRTTQAIHRMRKGRKTKFHPLATSDYNEGNTAENAKVLRDLLITQLGLSEEEIAKLLIMIGGDQSTVEKLRMLKKIAASCPHGYFNYSWVLPVIQLWHMGWADLERIINTHWGSEIRDMSSFCTTNIVMGQKVKDVKRPDYYPAQHLVFDSLKVEILDCWRKLLGQKNLEQYFEINPVSIEELLSLADKLVHRYCSMAGYMQALHPDGSLHEYFSAGKPWKRTTANGSQEPPEEGDQVLANAILRRRDSLIHYEFQYAIADDDIGRAMNVMAVWVFTFAGSGRHKYTNELLELICNFEFEYSPELQEAILNNWLCNLSGIEGCWFPNDLLQEKDIGHLKTMAERKDATFGGSFYRQIVSINVRAFLDTISTVASAFGLGEKGGSHRRVKKEAMNKQLLRHIEDEGLNTFRKGRTSGHVARDDWTMGDMCFNDGKRIKDFIARTLRDAGNIHAPEDITSTTDDDVDLPQTRPLPSVLIDGILVQGDEMYGEHEVTAEEKELVDYICETGDTVFDGLDSERE